MSMDQEVDVNLFITCRLCLDERGSFQIIPSIKEQIRFCFGIDIDPFDGLPQLICKKCKGILTECYSIKNNFLCKQQQLHTKPIKENQPAETLVAPHTGSVNLPVAHVTTPEDSVIPAAVPDVHSKAAQDVAGQSIPKKKSSLSKIRSSWKKAYNRHFACALCDKSYLTEKSIKKHSITHKKVINEHKKFFKRCLMVRLIKIDKKDNTTGNTQNVVLNKDKIVTGQVKLLYHSFYLKKGISQAPTIESDKNENVAAERRTTLSDSCDDEIIKGKKRKTGRLISTSSTQTVVFEETANGVTTDHQTNTNESEIVNTEFINLDVTSSDCPRSNIKVDHKQNHLLRQKVNVEVADYKAIQNIVTMCQKNYIKKIQNGIDGSTNPTFSESSLKHKVLSLGRKVINRQGFQCTGLLRYMEHKDLDITWTRPTKEMRKKGSNFVRLNTKLKSREDSKNDDACWKNLHDVSFCRDSGQDAEEATLSGTVRSDTQERLAPGNNDEDPSLTSAPCESNDVHNRKLLNKTPVANPRKLPKKNIIVEIKPVPINSKDTSLTAPELASAALADPPVEDDNMCLPIITSTTSLSVNVNEEGQQEVPVADKPAPRIKVKPASELMSPRALNNQVLAEDVWAFNSNLCSLPHHLTKTTVCDATPVTGSQTFISTQASGNGNPVTYQNDTQPLPSNNREYIILDSPQFPNNKTLTPFDYFRKVLLVHGLKLLDLNEELSDNFNCLIKFKLMLRQNARVPISVLLSLLCLKDTFSFSFKDTYFKQFDPKELPAFWQWELLKIYKSTVRDKILQNSLKLGRDVHEKTKLFLSLLNSINLVKEES